MPTKQEVATACDQATATALTGYLIAFGNVNSDALSLGQVTFVSQKIDFRKNAQFELGRPQFSRTSGAISFIIHVRKGTGSASTTTIQNLIEGAFRSKQIGGATFFDARAVNLGEDKQWSKTWVEIPFHFEESPTGDLP